MPFENASLLSDSIRCRTMDFIEFVTKLVNFIQITVPGHKLKTPKTDSQFQLRHTSA